MGRRVRGRPAARAGSLATPTASRGPRPCAPTADAADGPPRPSARARRRTGCVARPGPRSSVRSAGAGSDRSPSRAACACASLPPPPPARSRPARSPGSGPHRPSSRRSPRCSPASPCSCCRGWAGSRWPAALLCGSPRPIPGSRCSCFVAAAPVPLLLPRKGVAWSLPAAAPLLGLAGLAGRVAGDRRAGARLDRARALGALGGLWLVLAEALTSERLLTGQPRDVLAARGWDGSVIDAAADALVPLLAGGTLAIAALWALAAAVLPCSCAAARRRWTSSRRPAGRRRSPPRRRRSRGARARRAARPRGWRALARRDRASAPAPRAEQDRPHVTASDVLAQPGAGPRRPARMSVA